MTTATGSDLLTAAKLADAWGVPKARLAKLLKDEKVVADQVKSGCSYYSPTRLAGLKAKLAR